MYTVALFLRAATAQRDIATALGVDHPAYLDDIIAHLTRPSVVSSPHDELNDEPGQSRAGGDRMVWAAAEGYGWRNSSLRALGFSTVLFPLWPSETVRGLAADAETRKLAQASAKLYANFSCAGHPWPEPPFETCVDAGWGALTVFSAAVRALPGEAGEPHALTASEIADGLEAHVAAYGANASNLLAFAPGGGVEHVGMSHAVNEMLAQSDGEHVVLFPAWPADEPAAFSTLRVKGAFLVSAGWDHVERAAKDVQIQATVAASCSLSWPWAQPLEADGVHRAQIECSGGSIAPSEPAQASRALQLEADALGRMRWHMLAGQTCALWPAPAGE